MSRSKRPQPKPGRWDGGWILETSKEQRNRLKREVARWIKDPEHEVVLEVKGPKNAFDYP